MLIYADQMSSIPRASTRGLLFSPYTEALIYADQVSSIPRTSTRSLSLFSGDPEIDK